MKTANYTPAEKMGYALKINVYMEKADFETAVHAMSWVPYNGHTKPRGCAGLASAIIDSTNEHAREDDLNLTTY